MMEDFVCIYAYVMGSCIKDFKGIDAPAQKCSYPDCEYSKSEEFIGINKERQECKERIKNIKPRGKSPLMQLIEPEDFIFQRCDDDISKNL